MGALCVLCMHMRVCMRTCVCAYMCVCACMHVYEHHSRASSVIMKDLINKAVGLDITS